MENNTEVEKKKQNPISIFENIGNKVGTVVTEFFIGKQPTKEEKEEIELKKKRLKQLKSVQEEAQFRRDMELARQGKYVPPVKVSKTTEKKKDDNLFSNLGKHNPIEGFMGVSKAPDLGISGLGSNNSSNTPDFGLDEFKKTKNPMKNK